MSRDNFLSFFIRGLISFAGVPLLLAGTIHGQATNAGQTPAAPTTTMVRNADEVSIDFMVRDKKKKPVLDMKADDVAITDDGSAVKVSNVHLVTGQSGADHLITLLFDPLDASAATNARDVARKVLKQIPANGFSFSVFSVDRRLRLFQDFTADRNAIQNAVGVATGEEGTNRDQAALAVEKKLISTVQSATGQAESQAAGSQRAAEQGILASLKESQRIMQEQHTLPQLAGLLALVRSQIAIPGRKVLIYFTSGMLPQADVRDMVRSISDAANRAEVSIYVINQTAVDTKLMEGLMETAAVGQVAAANHANALFPAAGQNQAPMAFGPGLATSLTDTLVRMEGEGLAGNRDPMAGVAADTGGAYIYSEDGLKKPFRRAVVDLTTYYEASYVPPALEYNGKFRAVTVKSLRNGLKVQSRAGYFAVPLTGGVRPFEAPLLKILAEPQLPSDVKFRSAVLQLGNLTTGNENTLVVEVPISSLDTRNDPNANLASWHLAIVSQIKDKSGAVVEHFSEDIPGHGSLDMKDEGAIDSAILQRHFTLSPGQYTLETAVVDRHSGKVGAQRTLFDVGASTSGPFLSDVALVNRIDSFADEVDPFEPLRYQRGKVVPTISGQVVPGPKGVSFFFLVRPDASISEPALLEMQVLRNGELMGQVPLQLPKDLSEAFPYLASLKTSSLPAGNYDVRLSLAQGGRVTERDSSFRIAGPELANAALGKESATAPSNADTMPDTDSADAEVDLSKRRPLEITSLPPDSVARPSEDELGGIVSGARKRALNYSAKLPNFLCVEVTDRSVDPSGNGRWHRKDSFAELLRYADNHETRTTLEVNGRPGKVNRADMNEWPLSLGEFGDLLNLVFQPASKADFQWKETDALAGGRVQVFEYKVERNNNSMLLADSSRKVYAGFHGLAYIDGSTMGIRRLTMEADDLPLDFSIHAASISVDYDYVSVGQHDYLMPIRGTMRLKRGKHESDLNQIVFQDYRRYASQVKIIAAPPTKH